MQLLGVSLKLKIIYRKGNEAQAMFNSEVEGEAMDELEGESHPSQSVEGAKAALEKENW